MSITGTAERAVISTLAQQERKRTKIRILLLGNPKHVCNAKQFFARMPNAVLTNSCQFSSKKLRIHRPSNDSAWGKLRTLPWWYPFVVGQTSWQFGRTFDNVRETCEQHLNNIIPGSSDQANLHCKSSGSRISPLRWCEVRCKVQETGRNQKKFATILQHQTMNGDPQTIETELPNVLHTHVPLGSERPDETFRPESQWLTHWSVVATWSQTCCEHLKNWQRFVTHTTHSQTTGNQSKTLLDDLYVRPSIGGVSPWMAAIHHLNSVANQPGCETASNQRMKLVRIQDTCIDVSQSHHFASHTDAIEWIDHILWGFGVHNVPQHVRNHEKSSNIYSITVTWKCVRWIFDESMTEFSMIDKPL